MKKFVKFSFLLLFFANLSLAQPLLDKVINVYNKNNLKSPPSRKVYLSALKKWLEQNIEPKYKNYKYKDIKLIKQGFTDLIVKFAKAFADKTHGKKIKDNFQFSIDEIYDFAIGELKWENRDKLAYLLNQIVGELKNKCKSKEIENCIELQKIFKTWKITDPDDERFD